MDFGALDRPAGRLVGVVFGRHGNAQSNKRAVVSLVTQLAARFDRRVISIEAFERANRLLRGLEESGELASRIAVRRSRCSRRRRRLGQRRQSWEAPSEQERNSAAAFRPPKANDNFPFNFKWQQLQLSCSLLLLLLGAKAKASRRPTSKHNGAAPTHTVLRFASLSVHN